MNAIRRASGMAPTVALAMVLFGCSPESPKARYTVDEYLANPQAMDARLEECANNPGDLRDDPDCINVRAAAERQGVGSLRDLPPMRLASPQEKSGADNGDPTRDSGSRQ